MTKKVGFVCGAFDLLHAGHIHLLKQCKKNCDFLIVGLHANPNMERVSKNRPIESLLERQIKLNACRYVDLTVIYETEADLSLIFRYFKINIRFLGSDYNDTRNPKPITDPNAVPIHYVDSLPIHTSELKERIKNA